jgi:hypothetical protein
MVQCGDRISQYNIDDLNYLSCEITIICLEENEEEINGVKTPVFKLNMSDPTGSFSAVLQYMYEGWRLYNFCIYFDYRKYFDYR